MSDLLDQVKKTWAQYDERIKIKDEQISHLESLIYDLESKVEELEAKGGESA